MIISGPSCCAHGIQGYGSVESGIVFIGIAPGRNEIKLGKPFVGQSGKLLDAVLASVGIARESVYCTNLICWWKDEPTQDEINTCWPRLQRELASIKPKLIVALGGLACKQLFNLPLNKARGAVLRLPNFNNAYGLATYHPAAALHPGKTLREKENQINFAYDLVRDLNKLPRILDGLYNFDSEITYTVIDTPQAAQRVLDLATQQPKVMLDIETDYDKEYDKAHPFSDNITCIGIGWEPHHSYVLTPDAITQNLNWRVGSIKYGYHHGQFDTQKIHQRLGVWLTIVNDTLLKAYCIDERPKSLTSLLKLKNLSREYVGEGFYEENEHNLDGTPESKHKLYTYNAHDVCNTFNLDAYLEAQLDSDARSVYENILIPAANMLARSQARGIHIDTHAADELKGQFAIELLTLQHDLRQQGAQFDFTNETFLNSPKQLIEFLGCLGISVTSTAKAIIEELLETDEIIDDFPQVHDFLTKLRRYRTLYKLLKGYLLEATNQIKYDGYVHPHAFLTGTVTGRLTYKDPAMQTLPKPKTVRELARIRKIFAASSPDYILLEADYAQIEGWIAAFLSQDPILLQDLQSGNWHTLTTEAVFNVNKASCDSDTWAFYYDGGKHLNYGCLFEEGPEGLTRRPPIGMGCDINTARVYHRRWYERYHVYDAWRKQIKKQARELGYVQTPFKRKRRFPLIVNDHQLRQAVNAPIQSTAGDYTLTSCVKLDEPLRNDYDTHLLFIEHDAGYWEVLKRHLLDVLNLIKQVMEAPPLPGLPSIKVEMAIGNNLHDMQGIKLINGIWCVETNKDNWEAYNVA